jgi:hypothetical protein
MTPSKLLYGRQTQSLIPVHKAALMKKWTDQVAEYDRQAADHKRIAERWND